LKKTGFFQLCYTLTSRLHFWSDFRPDISRHCKWPDWRKHL